MVHIITRRLAGALLVVSTAAGLVMLDGAAPAVGRVDAACGIAATLRMGARGEAVRCLQATLGEAGFAAGPADGVFGPVTYRATTAFQRASGLVVDGVVGPQTGGALGIWGVATGSGAPAAPIDRLHPAGRRSGRRGTSGRGDLVGRHGRRRPAGQQRWRVGVRPHGHARPGRPQRRRATRRPPLGRRHDARRRVRTRHDDGAGRPDVPVLRQRRQPRRERRVAPGPLR